MSEPLDEAVEESWLEYFNRFNDEIYPNIFRAQGLTRAEALVLWEMANLRGEIVGLAERIAED